MLIGLDGLHTWPGGLRLSRDRPGQGDPCQSPELAFLPGAVPSVPLGWWLLGQGIIWGASPAILHAPLQVSRAAFITQPNILSIASQTLFKLLRKKRYFNKNT